MPKRMDLVGQRFNMLTVVDFYDVQNGMSRWVCKCDCGNEKVIYGRHLKSGSTVSCGCFHREHNWEYNYKHGDSKSRLYTIWCDMRDRCKNENTFSYRWYGGKGITVCEEWSEYQNFKNWALANGYNDTLTIDRIDSNKNYCPSNCQWISMKDNMDKSRRKNSGIAIYKDGQEERFNNLAEFANLHNLNKHSVQCAARMRGKFEDWTFILD